MKKFQVIVLAIALFFVLAACRPAGMDDLASINTSSATLLTEEDVRNHPVTPASDFSYRVENNTVIITDYIGTDPVVVIPETINGMPVVDIDHTANLKTFGFGSIIKGLMLPSGIKVLRHSTFLNNLTLEVVIWDNAQHIGDYVFCNCSSLRILVLGEDVIGIGVSAILAGPDLVVHVANSFMEDYCKDYGINYTTE